MRTARSYTVRIPTMRPTWRRRSTVACRLAHIRCHCRRSNINSLRMENRYGLTQRKCTVEISLVRECCALVVSLPRRRLACSVTDIEATVGRSGNIGAHACVGAHTDCVRAPSLPLPPHLQCGSPTAEAHTGYHLVNGTSHHNSLCGRLPAFSH